MPLANDAIDVARLLKRVGEGFLAKRKSEVWGFVFSASRIEFMAKAGSVFSGKKSGPRRTAVRCGDISLGKTDSFLGDRIDMRGRYFFIPLTTQFSIPKIVC